VTLSLLADPAYRAGASSTATVRIADRAYDDWRFARFRPLQRIDEAVSGFEAVSPRGVANGLAFALGLDPSTATPAALPRHTTHGGRFALTFTRPVGRGGVIYRVESSTSLAATWQAMPEENLLIQPNGDGTETVIAPAPPGENPAGFLRLRVLPE
jgi:hypothetical protein